MLAPWERAGAWWTQAQSDHPTHPGRCLTLQPPMNPMRRGHHPATQSERRCKGIARGPASPVHQAGDPPPRLKRVGDLCVTLHTPLLTHVPIQCCSCSAHDCNSEDKPHVRMTVSKLRTQPLNHTHASADLATPTVERQTRCLARCSQQSSRQWQSMGTQHSTPRLGQPIIQ